MFFHALMQTVCQVEGCARHFEHILQPGRGVPHTCGCWPSGAIIDSQFLIKSASPVGGKHCIGCWVRQIAQTFHSLIYRHKTSFYTLKPSTLLPTNLRVSVALFRGFYETPTLKAGCRPQWLYFLWVTWESPGWQGRCRREVICHLLVTDIVNSILYNKIQALVPRRNMYLNFSDTSVEVWCLQSLTLVIFMREFHCAVHDIRVFVTFVF